MRLCMMLSALLAVFLSACDAKTDQKSPDTPQEKSTNTTMTEDELLLHLSPYMIAEAATQGERDQNAIVDYAIDKQLPLERTRTGLFYQVLTPGAGEQLAWGDYIKVHYKGYFLDGKVFDDTRRRNKPLQFYIGNMIQGWNEGLQLVAPGGKILLVVPSPLAYAGEGLPDGKGGLLVPPDTPLVFEVEVLEQLEGPN